MDEEKNEGGEGVSEWLKDNLRIIVSVAIVVAIAGGIYSYSQRTQPTTSEDVATIEDMAGKDEEAVEIAAEESEVAGTETGKDEAEQERIAQTDKEEVEVAAAPAESRETETSFVETAVRGDGVTHLARRTLANYLEKNPDSSLTPAHKIYIEDYLRKNAGFTGRVFVGTSVEFEKELIQKAIDEAKNLNEGQLKNLQKYANMVPSLS